MPGDWTGVDTQRLRNNRELNTDALAVVRGYGRFVPDQNVVDSREELFIGGGNWNVESHDLKFGMGRIWANDRHLLIDSQPVKIISLRDRFRARDRLTGAQIVERLRKDCLLTGEHFLNACLLDHIVHSGKLGHAQEFSVSKVLGLVGNDEQSRREVLFLGTEYSMSKTRRRMVRALTYSSCSTCVSKCAYRVHFFDEVWDLSKLDVAVVVRKP
jgi:hypothetical protein